MSETVSLKDEKIEEVMGGWGRAEEKVCRDLIGPKQQRQRQRCDWKPLRSVHLQSITLVCWWCSFWRNKEWRREARRGGGHGHS